MALTDAFATDASMLADTASAMKKLPLLLAFQFLLASASAQDLIVSEILSQQASADTADFWELTNIGASPIDLSGWSWDDDSRTADVVVIPDGVSIAPGESIVFAGMDAADFRAWWGIPASAQVIGDAGAPGLGQGDGIALFDANDAEVLFFSYAASGFTRADGGASTGGHAGASAGAPTATRSLVIDPSFGSSEPRYTFASASELGAFSSAIDAADIASPGVVDASTASDNLLLTELLSNQEYDTGEDFWELTNVGFLPIDLTDWSWDDENPVAGANAIPSATVIAPGESIVFTAMDAAAFRAWWGIAASVQVITTPSAPGLGQNDTIALFDSEDQPVFAFTYAAAGFTRSDGSGAAGGHAGISAGGSLASQSLVVDPTFGSADPRYTFADGINHGTTVSDLHASDFGSPGIAGLSSGGPTFALSLDIAPATFSESAVSPAATATVSRSGPTGAALEVSLSSSDEGEATVPATVSILSGQATATFDVSAVDDAFPDGDQVVTITATAPGATPGAFELTVEDDGDVLDVNLLLTEVSSNQSNTAPEGAEDFWELTNFGSESVDLEGYSWHDSGRSAAAAAAWALPDGAAIAPGESVIFTEASAADFRAWWGLDESVQVFQSVGAPGLGQADGISLFDEGGNEIFFFSYAPGGFTLENGDLSNVSGHAGVAGGGAEDSQSLIWVPGSGFASPRYTAATGNNFGSFSAPGAGDIGSPGRIEEPVIPSNSVSIADASVEEGDSGTRMLRFPVTRTATAGAFSVSWATSAGTATDGDFQPEAGTLAFAVDGDATQYVEVAVVGDTLVEGDETFSVTLSNLVNTTGETVLGNATATGTLSNDDLVAASYPPSQALGFSVAGSIALAGAEIPAFDAATDRAFVSSGGGVIVVDLSDPASPSVVTTINLVTLGLPSNDVSSVDVHDGVLAACVIASPKTAAGAVAFIDTDTLALLGWASVGANPDQLAFSPDGSKVLVANEGELAGAIADDATPGSVSIIDLSGGFANPPVATAGFAAFNAQADALKAAGVRIFEGGLPEFDFEPEYVAIAPDGATAMVALQEANAVALLDIATATFTEIVPLGEKDFSQLRADFSDEDGPNGGGLINPMGGHPVFGLYMPDTMASYVSGGATYYITANEGDDRDDFLPTEETIRLGDDAYVLDATAFPNAAELKQDAHLGRLTVSNSPGLRGDTDNDGDIDRILALGARSFSILDEEGAIVFDSGDMLEVINASLFPESFDDGRSDNKGPEPEGVTVATIAGRSYAFIGLERSNMILVFDVTNPTNAIYVEAFQRPGDESPEGMVFVSASDSPSGAPLLLVANEGSNTLTVFELTETNELFTLELLHAADQEASAAAVADAPRFSAVLNALRAQDLGEDEIADNTLTLSSGDAIIPGLFFSASSPVYGSGGIADIEIQNQLGFQATALGNHEFDFGTAVLAGLIDGSATGEILDADFAGTSFPYLSGNLDFSADASMAPLETPANAAPQPASVTASVVIDVNGEKIGVVGATTPTLGIISSPGDLGIAPSPFAGTPNADQLDALAALIQADVDALLAAHPDMNKVVLLAHMQSLDIERALAKRLAKIDIIVGGGSNTRLLDEDDRLRAGDSKQGEYPEFHSNAEGKLTALVNTDGSYKYVGRLVIDFNAAGDILPASYDPAIGGAYATDAQGVADLGAEALVDPEIQRIADEIGAQILATEANVYGVSSVFLNGNRSGVGGPDDPDGVRTQETNLGNLTADANLAEARKNDATVVASIKNGGGIRASIGRTVVPAGGSSFVRLPNEEIRDGDGAIAKPAGGVSQNDIATALAFNNALSLLTLSKPELIAIVEHGVSAMPSAAGSFGQVGGLRFSFDPSLPAGARVRSLAVVDDAGEVADILVKNGQMVGESSDTYRIVTLSFLADGGDGYPFPEGTSTNRVDLAEASARTGNATFADDGTEQDALAEYLFANYNGATAFSEDDAGPSQDARIQNLAFRDDAALPATAFELWSSEFPGLDLGDPLGHVNGNALSNFELYAFGLDPRENNSDRRIQVSGNVVTQRAGLTLLAERNGDEVVWRVRYIRHKFRALEGLSYALEIYDAETQTWEAAADQGDVIASSAQVEVFEAPFPAELADAEPAALARIKLVLD